MIILGIPSRNLFDFVFSELIPSACKGTVIPDVIFLWDNSDGAKLKDYAETSGREQLGKIALEVPFLPKFIAYGTGRNEALSAVWNTIIDNAKDDDTIILSNDDLTFLPDTIEKLAKAEHEFNYPSGARAGNSFSLFSIKKWLWYKVGPFDVNFYPAYFEDNDYHYRMKLLGYDIYGIPDAEYNHIGSGTIKSLSKEEVEIFHKYSRRNSAYYNFKWKGSPGKEQHTAPFGGQNPEQAIVYFNRRYIFQ